MAEIVQDIQKPQGTDERTNVGLGTTPDQTGQISTAFNTWGKVLESRSKGSSQKDYGPLVRALEDYKDWSTSAERLDSDKEIEWNALVEWAGSQGYTHSDIDGYSKTIGTDIPVESMKEFQKLRTSSLEARQKTLEKNAAAIYPSIPTEEAMQLYLRDLSNSQRVQMAGEASQSMTDADREALNAETEWALTQEITAKFHAAKVVAGINWDMNGFSKTYELVERGLLEAGWDPAYVSYMLSWTTEGFKAQAKDSQADMKERKDAQDLEQGILMNTELENVYSQKIPLAVYELTDDRDNPYKIKYGPDKKPIYENTSLARVITLSKVNSELFNILWSNMPAQNRTLVAQALMTSATNSNPFTVTPNDMSKQQAMSLVGMFSSPAQLMSSSSNPNVRTSGINLGLTALGISSNEEVPNSPDAGPVYPQMLRNELRGYDADSIKAWRESSDEKTLKGREVAADNMRAYSGNLFQDFPSSLPLFGADGALHLYSFDKSDSLSGYKVTDISNEKIGSDSNLFRNRYKVQVQQYIKDLMSITGWDEKTVKDMYNNSVMMNSLVGKQIFNGLDTHNRGLLGFFQDMGIVLGGKSYLEQYTQYPQPTVEQADYILNKLLKDGNVDNILSPEGSSLVYPEGNRMVAESSDGTSITLSSTLPGDRENNVIAPTSGTVIPNVSARSLVFIEDTTGNMWTMKGVAIPYMLKADTYEVVKGSPIAYQDPTGNGVSISISDKSGKALNVKDYLNSKVKGRVTQFLEGIGNTMIDTAKRAMESEEVVVTDDIGLVLPPQESVRGNYKVIEDSSVSFKNNIATVEGNEGASIVSPVSGTVVFAGSIGRNSGNVLQVKAEDGTIWAVSSKDVKADVAAGQTVQAGDNIATAGKSGKVEVRHYNKKGFWGSDGKLMNPQGTPQPPERKP